MIVVQVLLALIIFVGLAIGLFLTGINAGIKFTTQFPEDEEPIIYERGDEK